MTTNVQINGKLFNILAAEADARNVTVAAIVRAVLRRVSKERLEEILNSEDLSAYGKPSYRKDGYRKPHPKKTYEWRGRPYTLTQLSRLFNVPVTTLYMRLHRGMSVDAAVSVSTKKRNKDFVEQCRKHNLQPEVVRGRLKMGWDLDRALSTPVRGRVQ